MRAIPSDDSRPAAKLYVDRRLRGFSRAAERVASGEPSTKHERAGKAKSNNLNDRIQFLRHLRFAGDRRTSRASQVRRDLSFSRCGESLPIPIKARYDHQVDDMGAPSAMTRGRVMPSRTKASVQPACDTTASTAGGRFH